MKSDKQKTISIYRQLTRIQFKIITSLINEIKKLNKKLNRLEKI